MRCNVMYCVCNISLRADVHAYLHAYGLVFVATEIRSRKNVVSGSWKTGFGCYQIGLYFSAVFGFCHGLSMFIHYRSKNQLSDIWLSCFIQFWSPKVWVSRYFQEGLIADSRSNPLKWGTGMYETGTQAWQVQHPSFPPLQSQIIQFLDH